MKVDAQQFTDQGFIILRNVVPPERLQRMRLTIELLVDRQKALSATERTGDIPLGGDWYQSAQPRVNLDQVVDADTREAIEFCLGDNTMGVSRRIMQADCAPTEMQVSCSSIVDHGYTDWHRDSSAAEQTPLSGLQMDLLDNRPGYVQWNIALYDDDVFWVVPGSHRRGDNEQERKQLLLDPRVPLPDGQVVDLKAGDGIVYTNLIMHWGSFYSSRMRRTIHLGYRSFGGDIFPYCHHFEWDSALGFARHLSPGARALFEGFVQRFAQERDCIEAVLRNILDQDAEVFKESLARLHPGARQRMTTVVLLARLADKIHLLHTPGVAAMSRVQQEQAVAGPSHHDFHFDLGARFSMAEAETLKRRFAPLSERLQGDGDKVHAHYAGVLAELKPDAPVPNFESRPLRTFHTEMPANFDLDEFLRSWNESPPIKGPHDE